MNKFVLRMLDNNNKLMINISEECLNYICNDEE